MCIVIYMYGACAIIKIYLRGWTLIKIMCASVCSNMQYYAYCYYIEIGRSMYRYFYLIREEDLCYSEVIDCSCITANLSLIDITLTCMHNSNTLLMKAG